MPTTAEPTVGIGGRILIVDPSVGRLNSWDEGRAGLIQFLNDLKKLMADFTKERVIESQRGLFDACLPDVIRRIDEVVQSLGDVSDGDESYSKLHEVGLTGNPLALKLREFYVACTSRSIAEVLHVADIILGSLFKVFAALEPVKEFKETLETRLKNGGDQKVIESLNLTGREQWWQSGSGT